MKSLDFIIGLLIDGGVFYGVNEILNAGGLKMAKPDMSDITIYVLVDALVKKGYLVNADLIIGLGDVFEGKEGMSTSRSRDVYVALLAAIGMIIFDSVQKKKIKIVAPLVKAFAGQFGNILIDETFGLKRIN